MQQIDKIVKSKYPPRNTEVMWVDLSEDNPTQKVFINGKWESISGGIGTSNPTEADATKVWQVTPVLKETKIEETVIVPEQTLVNGQELEYNDKFVPGAQCVAVINGVEYRGEVVDGGSEYVFTAEGFIFVYGTSSETFVFLNKTEFAEVTAKLSIIEETPIYDYNWVPGVKIPIPTAEDEGKILVVTETEGNASIIVPEQQVPADVVTPLTDVDLTKFVVGNTVKVTVSANSETFTATGVIIDDGGVIVDFDFDGDEFSVWQTDNLLYTDAIDCFGPNLTIKLEYLEPNYEYQLQENSGSNNGTFVIECEYYEDDSYVYWVLPYTESVTLLTDFKESGASLVELRLTDNGEVYSRFSLMTDTATIDYWKFLGYSGGNVDQIVSLSSKTINGTNTIVLRADNSGGR